MKERPGASQEKPGVYGRLILHGANDRMEARMDASAGVANRGFASRWNMLSSAPATETDFEMTMAPSGCTSAGLSSLEHCPVL
jgi:hypothetical protein